MWSSLQCLQFPVTPEVGEMLSIFAISCFKTIGRSKFSKKQGQGSEMEKVVNEIRSF